jgi:peptide/nickel transport system permease protein
MILTLWIVSLIVFFAGQILPGDPGRAILGPFASKNSVQILDTQLGVNRPLLTRYLSWIGGLLHGNFGTSYSYRTAVEPFIHAALINSLKLAALAFVIVVPLGIIGGVVAALFAGRALDRIISVTGLSLATVPELVTSIVLIVVFGVELKVLPVTASAGQGAGDFQQFRHLILPAIPLVLVLFGYIARMARAGTIEALNSDYARTAVLKGLPRSTMIRRHVLRNSLLPTITVIATQTGYLIGGLVVVETIFNYQGIGNLIYKAATAKDFPMLEAGVLTIGVVYVLATLVADLLLVALNPRLRIGDSDDPLGPEPVAVAVAVPAQRGQTRWRLLLRRPTFLVGGGILLFWVICAIFGHQIAPDNPLAQNLLSANIGPSGSHWFGTDPLGRDVLSRVLVGARNILLITPLATVLGTILGTALGLAMGYFGGAVDLIVGRLVEAVLALPAVIIAFLFIVALGASTTTLIIVIGFIFTPLIARTVRAAVLTERNLDYLSSARLLGENPVRIMFGEILPNVMPAILVEFTVRLGYAIFTVATLSFLGFGVQPPTPDWGADIAANYVGLLAGYWWQTLFPALAIASLVTSINLITDSIEQVLNA